MSRYRVVGQRTLHGRLAAGADLFLNEYESRVNSVESEGSIESGGSFHFLLASIMFSAFYVEGYINIIGSKLLAKAWPENLSWKEKIWLIYALAKQEPKFGAEPLQTIQKLFKIRNGWAHAKPETVDGEFEYDILDNDSFDPLSSDFEKCITPEFAKECAAEAKKFFECLLVVSGVEWPDTVTSAVESGVD